MKIRIFAFVLSLLLAALAATGCSKLPFGNTDKNSDGGNGNSGDANSALSLSVGMNDIAIKVGDEVQLVTSLYVGDKASAIEYTFSGESISIENGVLRGLVANTETSVTATSDGFVGTFKVKVEEAETYVEPEKNELNISFKNVSLDLGGEMMLVESVIIDNVSRPLTYTFDGNNISIENYVMTALKYNTVTTVTAKADGCSASFSVSVGGDVGTMSIEAPTSIYTNYAPKEIKVSFSDPRYASAVEYTTNNSQVFVENGAIYAKGDFPSTTSVKVTAKSEYHTESFTVSVSKFNKHSAETKVQWYENNVIKESNKGGTIFIGDSYFDGYMGTSTGKPAFWSDFYEDYTDKKTFLMGISSSQIDTWEIVSERIVYPMQPKEIIFHIGFNDAHSSTNSANEIASRIIALIDKFHEKLPDTTIYYCSVEPKKNALTSPDYNYSSMVKAPAINAMLSDFADTHGYVKMVDTRALCFNSDGSIDQSFYLSTDLSHPTLDAYDKYRAAIEKAKKTVNKNYAIGELKANQSAIEAEAAEAKKKGIDFTITNLDGSSDIVTSGKTYTAKNGGNLTSYYSISGYMDITAITKGSSPHLQLRVSHNNPGDTRLLLWDSDNDGKLGICYINAYGDGTMKEVVGKNPYADAFLAYDNKNSASITVTLKWQVIVTDTTAYFFINDVLVEIFEGISGQYFNIGTKYMNANVYGVQLVEKADNESAFNSILTEKKIG